MNISRLATPVPDSTPYTLLFSKLHGSCVGCSDCNGVCKELLDALVVPDVILSRKNGT